MNLIKFACVSIVLLLASMSVPIHASSVSATGQVHSIWTSGGVTFLKIERPDGSKVAADCASGVIANECAIANIGDDAWGRASCTMGYCAWTCIDVNPYCSEYSSGQHIQIEEAGVSGKESCAGVTYLTLIAVGLGEFKARCNSQSQSACDTVILNDTVNADIHFFCNEIEIDSLTIN